MVEWIMKVSKKEFDLFWDEVLGEDWFIDSDELLDDAPGPVIEITNSWLEWQGKGDPEPTVYITRRDLNSGPRLTTILKRWRKAQTTASVTAVFEVEHAALDAMIDKIRAIGGKVIA